MSEVAYCAFLRGVNLNGRTLRMAEVCDAFRAAGLTQVSSVLASGNICFASADDPAALRVRLQETLAGRFGMDVPLVVVSADDVRRAIANLPWPADAGTQRYVFFADAGVADQLWQAWLAVTPVAQEAAAVVDGQFYWRCAKGKTLDSGFSKTLGDKRFRQLATSRNANTVERVAAKLGQSAAN